MLKTKEEISQWLDTREIANFTINDDLTVDVSGEVDLRYNPMAIEEFSDLHGIQVQERLTSSNPLVEEYGDFGDGWPIIPQYKKLQEIPVAFRIVEGDFRCENNSLTSLQGTPQKIEGCFNCSGNKIESLLGGPQYVQSSYDCSNNQITDLYGAPDRAGSLQVYGNQTQTIAGAKTQIKEDFSAEFGVREFKHIVPNEINIIRVSADEFNITVRSEQEKKLLEAKVKRTLSIDLTNPSQAIDTIRQSREDQGLTTAPISQASSSSRKPNTQQRTFKI